MLLVEQIHRIHSTTGNHGHFLVTPNEVRPGFIPTITLSYEPASDVTDDQKAFSIALNVDEIDAITNALGTVRDKQELIIQRQDND